MEKMARSKLMSVIVYTGRGEKTAREKARSRIN